MAAISDFLEDELLDHVLRNNAYASPAAVYLGLFLTAPTDANTGTEVSGGSYARQAITFGAPAGGICLNSALMTFPTATANWGTITHIGIYDAVSAGNLLFHGALATSKIVNNGDTLSVPIGALSVQLA